MIRIICLNTECCLCHALIQSLKWWLIIIYSNSWLMEHYRIVLYSNTAACMPMVLKICTHSLSYIYVPQCVKRSTMFSRLEWEKCKNKVNTCRTQATAVTWTGKQQQNKFKIIRSVKQNKKAHWHPNSWSVFVWLDSHSEEKQVNKNKKINKSCSITVLKAVKLSSRLLAPLAWGHSQDPNSDILLFTFFIFLNQMS